MGNTASHSEGNSKGEGVDGCFATNSELEAQTKRMGELLEEKLKVLESMEVTLTKKEDEKIRAL